MVRNQKVVDGEWILADGDILPPHTPLRSPVQVSPLVDGGPQLDIIAQVRIELARIFRQPIIQCVILESLSYRVHLVQFRPEFYPDPVMPVVLGIKFSSQSLVSQLVKNHYRDWDNTYRAFVDVIFAYAQNYGHTDQGFTTRLMILGDHLKKLLAKSNLTPKENDYVSNWISYLPSDPLCKFGRVRTIK